MSWVWNQVPVIPATQEAYIGESQPIAGPRQKWAHIQKITKPKKVKEYGSSGRMLASQVQDLNSNPSIAKKIVI
jgi:hypothetical protein